MKKPIANRIEEVLSEAQSLNKSAGDSVFLVIQTNEEEGVWNAKYFYPSDEALADALCNMLAVHNHLIPVFAQAVNAAIHKQYCDCPDCTENRKQARKEGLMRPELPKDPNDN